MAEIEFPDTLVTEVAAALAFVDFGPNENPAEYVEYAKEVLGAFRARGLDVRPLENWLWSQELTGDGEFGTAQKDWGETLAPHP